MCSSISRSNSYYSASEVPIKETSIDESLKDINKSIQEISEISKQILDISSSYSDSEDSSLDSIPRGLLCGKCQILKSIKEREHAIDCIRVRSVLSVNLLVFGLITSLTFNHLLPLKLTSGIVAAIGLKDTYLTYQYKRKY